MDQEAWRGLGVILCFLGFLMVVFWVVYQYRMWPIRIAQRRGVNPALITALSFAADNRQIMGLAAYAALAEPDAERSARDQRATEQAVEQGFGKALDARLAPGYRGAPGYVPPSGRPGGEPPPSPRPRYRLREY